METGEKKLIIETYYFSRPGRDETPGELMMKKSGRNTQFWLGTAGFLFLMTVTFFHTQPPLFDEVLFVPNVYLFEEHGLTREFLVNLHNQAPGPLYEFVHYFFKPLTNLETPGIRLVNVFLFGLTILTTARLYAVLKKTGFFEGLVVALAIVAVPMVWQIAGLALTEMPAMFFAVLSVLLLVLALKQQDRMVYSTLMALAAGACLGLAILGRSPFLILVMASGLFLLYDLSSASRWRIVVAYAVVALSMCLPVFIIWEGLVPPQQAFVGKGFSIWHGILAFAYAGLMALIVAPRWFYRSKKLFYTLPLVYLGLLLVNIFFARYEYKPFYKAMAMILPDPVLQYYPFLVSPVLATLSLYFIGSSLYRLWERRHQPFFVFLLVSGMLLLASNFKVTHLFSTRYVGQAAAFLILAFTGYDRFTWSRWARLIAGMAIGYISLETYIRFG